MIFSQISIDLSSYNSESGLQMKGVKGSRVEGFKDSRVKKMIKTST
jgi:hypothetical protein